MTTNSKDSDYPLHENIIDHEVKLLDGFPRIYTTHGISKMAIYCQKQIITFG